MPSNPTFIQDAKQVFGEPHFAWHPHHERSSLDPTSLRASWVGIERAKVPLRPRLVQQNVDNVQQLFRQLILARITLSNAKADRRELSSEDTHTIDYLSIAYVLVQYPGALEAMLMLADLGPLHMREDRWLDVLPNDSFLETIAELYRNDLVAITGAKLSLTELGLQTVKKLYEHSLQDAER